MAKPRCKPGDMAFILDGQNAGKIVHVVRAYIAETRVCGFIWDFDGKHPWVIESTGSPLKNWSHIIGNKCEPLPCIVVPDHALKPIRPGKGTDEVLRITGKPKATTKPKTTPATSGSAA